MLDVASSLTRSWTDLYTRGLPYDQRATRIAEIESDIYEHRASDVRAGAAPADTGFEVLLRFIFGIPADLLWRHSAAAASQRSASSLMNMKGTRMFTRFMAGLAPVLVILLAAAQLFNGVGILLGARGENDWVWGLIESTIGVALVIGLLTARRSPRLGSAIIIATVVVAAGLHFWMAFIGVPVALAVIATTLVRARNRVPTAVAPS